jgi:NOL1/NOP2/fmu family ribosome biogenesis protein
MKLIKSSEKKKILKQLNQQFGIKKLPYLLLRFGKNKIRIYSGNLSTEELNILDKNLKIENIGLYFAKQEKDDIRLTLDGVQILKPQITKNILEINDKQAKEWLKGNDLIIETEKGFKILKNNNEFIGCGKSTGEKITNFVPKERRIK